MASKGGRKKTGAEDKSEDKKETKGSKAILSSSYTGHFVPTFSSRASEKGQEHAQAVVNLAELATVGIGALATAEVNHTRPSSSVWGWRIAELVSSLPVLAFTGQNSTLGRLALGVFLGAAVETLIDSTPGLTGWEVLPPTDSQVRYVVTE